MLVRAVFSRCLPVLASVLFSACVAKGPDQVTLKAGAGIKVDPSTQAISIDPATVPMLPSCATGQFVTHTADGNWQCVTPAQVTDAQTVGGKPASYFLPATAKAADSSQLNGKADTFFLAASGKAADSSLLNGKSDASFLPATGKATDSFKLNGQTGADFLPVGGKAASAFTADTAASAGNAGNLGSVPAARFLRQDPAGAPVSLPITETTGGSGFVRIGAPNGYGIQGSNSAGNFHLDADGSKTDGHIYLNWFSGKGVRFGNGASTEVASVDSAGSLKAASFNGLQIFSIYSGRVGTDHGCVSLCSDNGAVCLAAKLFPAADATPNGMTVCTTNTPPASVWSFSCYCAKF